MISFSYLSHSTVSFRNRLIGDLSHPNRFRNEKLNDQFIHRLSSLRRSLTASFGSDKYKDMQTTRFSVTRKSVSHRVSEDQLKLTHVSSFSYRNPQPTMALILAERRILLTIMIPAAVEVSCNLGRDPPQYSDCSQRLHFRHYTREALPRMDNYRDILSVQAVYRPTLDDLHNATMSSKVMGDVKQLYGSSQSVF